MAPRVINLTTSRLSLHLWPQTRKEGGGRARLLGKALADGPPGRGPAPQPRLCAPPAPAGASRGVPTRAAGGSPATQAITMALSPVPICPVDGDSELILILQTELSWGGFCGHFLPFIFPTLCHLSTG